MYCTKYCTKCGALNTEGANFCHNCGEKLVQPSAGQPAQHVVGNMTAQDLYADNESKKEQEMRPECSQLSWHKFLIYFLLIAEAIFYIFTAYSYISGTVFGENRDYIFMNFPDVVQIIKLNGFLYLALGLFTLIIRNSLAKFKSGAPGMLTLMYVFSALLALAGNFMVSSAFNSADSALLLYVFPVVHALFWIFVNQAYYKKREELFVN